MKIITRLKLHKTNAVRPASMQKKALPTGFLKIKVQGKCIIQWKVISKNPTRPTNQKLKHPISLKPSNQDIFCLLRIVLLKGTNYLMMCLLLHSSHASEVKRAAVAGLESTQDKCLHTEQSSMAALKREGDTLLKC